MAEEQQSLVRNEEQAEFFDEALGLELLEPEDIQRRRFTAERVALNQERYRMIVAALAENLPIRYICRTFRVSHHTLKTIREREPELIATEKQRLARLLGHMARRCVEAFGDALDQGKVPPNVLSVSTGIFLDKKALLEGEATARIEHVRDQGLTVEAVLDRIKRADATVSNLDTLKAPDYQSGGLALPVPDSQALTKIGASFGTTPAPSGGSGPAPQIGIGDRHPGTGTTSPVTESSPSTNTSSLVGGEGGGGLGGRGGQGPMGPPERAES